MKYLISVAAVIFTWNSLVFGAGVGGVGPPPAETVGETLSEVVNDFDLDLLLPGDEVTTTFPIQKDQLDKILKAVAENGLKPISGTITNGDKVSSFSLGDISVRNGTMEVSIGDGVIRLKSDPKLSRSNPATKIPAHP